MYVNVFFQDPTFDTVLQAKYIPLHLTCWSLLSSLWDHMLMLGRETWSYTTYLVHLMYMFLSWVVCCCFQKSLRNLTANGGRSAPTSLQCASCAACRISCPCCSLKTTWLPHLSTCSGVLALGAQNRHFTVTTSFLLTSFPHYLQQTSAGVWYISPGGIYVRSCRGVFKMFLNGEAGESNLRNISKELRVTLDIDLIKHADNVEVCINCRVISVSLL